MKYPGELDKDQQLWLDTIGANRGLVTIIKGDGKSNPLIPIYGQGPPDQKCKDCDHLFYHEFSKRYYKCRLRGDTRGAGTDHKVNWPACGRFKLTVGATVGHNGASASQDSQKSPADIQVHDASSKQVASQAHVSV